MSKSPALSRSAKRRKMRRKYRPRRVDILGKTYSVTYCRAQRGVNPRNLEEECRAFIDMESGAIRVFDGGRTFAGMLGDIHHEILHAIADEMGGPLADDKYHDDLNRYATVLADVIVRNGWLRGDAV